MQLQLDSLLCKYLHDPYITKTNTLQRLWSDYGEIARYYSPKLGHSFIVKHVAPPKVAHHLRGWHSNEGHQRKIRSYDMEATFYQSFAIRCDNDCYVPQFITLIKDSDCSEQQTLIIEDLAPIGYNIAHQTVSEHQIEMVLSWLARFHGRFLQVDTSTLWPIGSYWYLATRQAEFEVMPVGGLKQNAQIIAETLENAKFRTLIHGDAKLANFCFSHNKGVAAVDFQYVGRGVGIKDVMYFLGSCLSDKQLWKKHDEYFDYYFTVLNKVLGQSCVKHETNKLSDDFMLKLEMEWRALIPFAWADFNRFLQGWNPQHLKINDFMQAQTAQILSK